MAESPYPLRVLPAPPQPRSSVIKLPRATVAPDRAVVFEVEARDEFGNRLSLRHTLQPTHSPTPFSKQKLA